MSKGLETLKEIKERLVNETDFIASKDNSLRIKYCLNTRKDLEKYVDNILGVKNIEKELNAYETLLNVLFGPYLYNDGRGSNGWYLIGPMPCGEKVEIPITEKDANVLIQAGFKEK